jgi:hypothetical protein
MNDLRTEITRVRDAYRGQMKFCDIEAFGYFREFVRRLDDALASVAGAGTAETRNVAQGEARQNGAQSADAQPSPPSD